MIHLLDISIIEVAPVLLAAVRTRVSVSMLADTVSSSPVWERVRQRGIAHKGRNVVIYWGEKDEEVTVDVGVEIAEPFCGDEDLQCIQAPSGRAVTATHSGADHLLPSIHERIRAWSAEGERKLSGVRWEIFADEDGEPRETKVFHQIQEAKPRLPARKKWPRFNERSRSA